MEISIQDGYSSCNKYETVYMIGILSTTMLKFIYSFSLYRLSRSPGWPRPSEGPLPRDQIPVMKKGSMKTGSADTHSGRQKPGVLGVEGWSRDCLARVLGRVQ